MAIDAETEEHQVESRQLAAARPERVGQRRRVRGGGRLAVAILAMHPEDSCGRHRHARQQGFLRHSIVRFVVVRRHGAFVAEEDPRSIPRHARAERRTREPFIRRARRRAAGQTEHETPARLGRLVRGVDDELGRALGEPVCIRADGYAGIRSHTLIIPSRRSGAVALAHPGSARGGPGRV